MATSKLNVVGCIQARMGSTRLPRKVLKTIEGKTQIELIRDRLSFAKELDDILLATSTNPENDELARHGSAIGLTVHRGSETDLIERLLGAAKKTHADALVRITADCPLVDPTIVDTIVAAYRSKPDAYDYICNIFPPTYPDGMDVELLPIRTLQRLDSEISDPLYREWITTNIMEHPDTYRILNIPREPNLSYLRLTVDYPEDFELVEKIYKSLYKEGAVFTLDDILHLFEREPQLMEINKKWIDTTIVNNIRSHAFFSLKEDRDAAPKEQGV